MDLERRFLLWMFALLALGCVAYAIFDAQRSSIALIVVMGGVGAIASGIVHYVLFQPIRRIVLMAQAVGAGDFSRRLAFDRRDEIGSLALEMDAMCDQLEAARRQHEVHIASLEQLRHSDRVATLGLLASSVAHELGNPLNVIELRARMITSSSVASLHEAPKNASLIVEQTKRMTRIIEEILSFARIQPAKITHLDLVGVVRKAVALSEHTSKRHNASILFELPAAAIEIDGDADKLLQVIVNLAVNGIQAMPNGGALRVSMRDECRAAADDPDGVRRDYVCIDVADEGVGISTDAISRVFNPFFSTRNADGGTGLGLSVAQGIAHEHEGWITVASELGRGSVFTVHLPKHGLRSSGVHGG